MICWATSVELGPAVVAAEDPAAEAEAAADAVASCCCWVGGIVPSG
jgi:hypothetical protein